MTTQVIFKIDKKLKEKAMKRAQNEGIAFSSVLKLATEAYAKGSLDVQLVAEPRLNDKTRKVIEKALKDIKAGKNLSPAFDHAEDAIAYLKS
ncbi:MAG: hypothetical protein A3I07_01015 [Candidatus Doudnabacteria bacterium RIFCSPLOWO2_02_FULL_42_9]|uniref:Uncharacterized protein n=1 Tax=Candidatus Doudnabacteria bacterium RIFCSPHIGHO2_01_FULL_41_86 TaxID=1817821 RepID=A0A1F5N7T2_9BACT|nr:MAG: hypothetical protein A2717_00025 [Candidatus Doudnabacteria bacterium RIFCSPHIGHO2_01_FULL_41_86]OGE74954.1 MAG: hypothetical protein A3K07_03520 [Candidatus Doudnabacteria bacterium RIFCSPHIGHO2_01_43_10]OGE85608.1 MAG: hypothetical protein A3E28_04590 [Candidatus Doudnabacteria bacterium RIFCSPHIGHO2_12_FULL_42_22]OGE86545.1 MAG: hypothetical protein A3C49_00025 [Candidatus Doudnabacteria bacterium RIFCSPHIGHO2_02_FULL_42_25]OGE91962.1 MAG: hypothetical protein A2895_01170 [Candidatus